MSGELAAARSHPAIVVSVVVAAIAVTACALVAIAWMLGWVPAKSPAAPPPTAIAIPGTQVAGSAPDVALAPGETLVAPPDATRPEAPHGPATPRYAKPPEKLASPAPGEAPPPAAPPRPAPAIASTRPRAAPVPPAYAAPPPVTSYERSARSLCVNCGTIASIRSTADGEWWEVRVRFEDGSLETLRYPERPNFRAGDRVHLEDGRLLPE